MMEGGRTWRVGIRRFSDIDLFFSGHGPEGVSKMPSHSFFDLSRNPNPRTEHNNSSSLLLTRRRAVLAQDRWENIPIGHRPLLPTQSGIAAELTCTQTFSTFFHPRRIPAVVHKGGGQGRPGQGRSV